VLAGTRADNMPITRDPYSRTITASDGQLYPICLTKLTADPIFGVTP
jgi:hypothetical protein